MYDECQPDNAREFDQSRIPMKELTEREQMIAQEAAKLAVRMVTDEFYKNVGKNIVQKFFILVGAFAVGFGVAKGWISIPK